MMPELATEGKSALFSRVPGEAIKVSSGMPLALPEELSHNRHADITFTARFARLQAGGELRSVHIHGPRIEIINLFHFPASDRALPVYAMEFVLFGRRPIVGVIDAKPLNGHDYASNLWRDTLGDAHARFPDLVRADDPPEWYEECRSGLDFFTRPDATHGFERMLECHAHVWSCLAAAEADAPMLAQQAAADHATALAAYKDHHRINSPGLPFLQRTFGPEWTDRFLRTALFS